MEMNKKCEARKKIMEIDREFVDYPENPENYSLEDIKKFSGDNFKQEQKSVLGLDIYKYSSYDDDKQNLIPFIFDLIKDEAIKYAQKEEATLFKDYEFKFISTGDGGFIIFDTPLHALIFNFLFLLFCGFLIPDIFSQKHHSILEKSL